MEKKYLALILLIAATLAFNLSAYAETRLAGEMTWEWDSGKSRIRDIEEEDLSLGGIQFEILGQNLGYGLDALVDFRHDPLERWYFDWQGQLFLRYHLFGTDGFLDPFFEAGYGNAGSVLMEEEEDQELKLSLYPSFSAGLNLLFHEGLFVGSRLSYRPINKGIPATDIETVNLKRYQAALYIGVSLQHRRSRKNDYFDRYFERY